MAPGRASHAAEPPAARSQAERPAGAQPARPPTGGPLGLGLLLLVLGATAVAFVVGVMQGWLSPAALRELAARGGAASALAFVAAVLVLQLLWCPRFWGLAAAGMLFGPWLGMALSFVPDTLSALICYFLARRASGGWAVRRLARWPRAQILLRLLAVERGGLTLFLLRALPIHYTAVSYAAGVAAVPWRRYLVGTLLGALPGTVLYNFLGDSAHAPGGPAFATHLGAVLAVSVLGAVGARRLWRQAQAPGRTSHASEEDCGGAEGN